MKKVVNIKNDCRGMFNEEIIDAIFESRGIKDREHFMNPTEEDLLPLDSLYRVDEASEVFIDGIMNGKKFGILYDTDCDGISSGTIINRYLLRNDIEAEWYIDEGKQHGLTDEFVENIPDIDILIIVDSLDSDAEKYKKLYEANIQVIILDHHDIKEELEEEYDKYTILVSSNRRYKNPNLSGAGVCWKFVKYVDFLLGTMDADDFTDLAACGIVADMCDMSEASMENRAIVRMGLENLQNPAVKKILKSYEFNSTAISFSVAPIVNASNRMNKNETAVKAFLADEDKEVNKYVKELQKCKENQNTETSDLMDDIIEQCENQLDKKMLVVVIESGNGVTGLIGNKILSIYKRPVLVLKEGTTGYSGSGRAVGIEDFRSLCDSTELGTFAGHPNAFGVTDLLYSNFDKFREEIENALSDVEFGESVVADIELEISDVNDQLIDELKKIGRISGNGFKPVSIMITCDNFEPTTMSKGRHLVLNVGAFNRFQFIKWNAGDLLEEFEDYAMFCEEVSFIGSLDAGFIGKNYFMKMIVDSYIVKD